MYSIRRWLYRPKKTDKSLLACFFFADEELNSVAAELDSFDGRKDPDRCTVLVNKLRNCQDKVLVTIQSIMDDVIPYQRAPRDFRVKYPDDVIQESLLGQLWFGAECLAAGSCIMHREGESASMRPLARALTRTLDNLRNSLRDQCLRSGPHYHPKIRETLVMFDQLLAEFELSYVSAMVPVKSAKEFETMQDIVVLFSETVERALKRGLISRDMIDSCDPLLMFTIPRLAILSGLILYQEGPLYPEKEPESMSEMFRPFQTLLCKIKQLLFTLTPQEFTALERALCTSGETPPTTPPIDQSENQLNAPLSAHAQISISTSQTLVSNMIAGSGEEVVIGSLNAVMTHLPESTNEEPRSSHVTLKDEWAVRELENVIDDDDIDAQSPSEVFEDAREFLSPDVSLCDFEYDNKDTDQSASVLDQSDLPISTNHFRDPAGQPSPEVVKNNKIVDYDELSSHSVASSDGDSACDTISTSSSYSSSCNDDEEVLLAIKAAQMANRKGIRSKFKSSEELNHKLFVCISGVADQLQTNFASDLRNILRTVFTMHSSDSLDQSVPSKPVTSSEEGRVRFQIRHGRERLRAPPRWVPDDERSTCTGCSTLFTFVRRRHHCRNCGQIFCQQCSSATMSLPQFGHRLPVRVCLTCSNGRTQ